MMAVILLLFGMCYGTAAVIVFLIKLQDLLDWERPVGISNGEIFKRAAVAGACWPVLFAVWCRKTK